jgi:hypothetical protein
MVPPPQPAVVPNTPRLPLEAGIAEHQHKSNTAASERVSKAVQVYEYLS